MLGGPWWERPLQTAGDGWQNLTKGNWWNGKVSALGPDYPCSLECVPHICGLFSTWPTFTRAEVVVHDLTHSRTLTYPTIVPTQTSSTVTATYVEDVLPGLITGYSTADCRARIIDFFGLSITGSAGEIESGITDPHYVFTSRNSGYVLLKTSLVPAEVGYCEYRVRWFADP